MKNLQWGKGRSCPPRPRSNRAQLAARLASERTMAGARKREAYLRSLLGLPATPARDMEKESGR
jgi:hypothetical protein